MFNSGRSGMISIFPLCSLHAISDKTFSSAPNQNRSIQMPRCHDASQWPYFKYSWPYFTVISSMEAQKMWLYVLKLSIKQDLHIFSFYFTSNQMLSSLLGGHLLSCKQFIQIKTRAQNIRWSLEMNELRSIKLLHNGSYRMKFLETEQEVISCRRFASCQLDFRSRLGKE